MSCMFVCVYNYVMSMIAILGGQMRSKRSAVNLGFTFDLFVCVAILTMNSDIIAKGTDAASVYGYMNR